MKQKTTKKDKKISVGNDEVSVTVPQIDRSKITKKQVEDSHKGLPGLTQHLYDHYIAFGLDDGQYLLDKLMGFGRFVIDTDKNGKIVILNIDGSPVEIYK